MKKLIIFWCLFAMSSVLFGQYQIGHKQITFQDASRSNREVQAEIYYPASATADDVPVLAGNFPLIVFGHGFIMSWSSYDNFWNSLVPKGFILVFPTTEGGISPNHEEFGKDLSFLVSAMNLENANSASPFYNHILAKSAIMGHSMGGGASFLACTGSVQPTVMVTFAAAVTNPSSVSAATHVTIPSLVFSGSADCVAAPADNQQLMYDSLAADCKFFVSVTGGSHCYFANSSTACAAGELLCSHPITREEQQTTTMHVLVPFLNYFLKDQATAYSDLVDTLNQSTAITFIKNCTISPASVMNYETDFHLSLYPNPANECIYLSFVSLKNATITIYDPIGRQVSAKKIGGSSELQTTNINSSNMDAGMYLLEIEQESGERQMIKFTKAN